MSDLAQSLDRLNAANDAMRTYNTRHFPIGFIGSPDNEREWGALEQEGEDAKAAMIAALDDATGGLALRILSAPL